jgi:hypothetical protein
MWIVLFLILIGLPAHIQAQQVGDLSPNPNSNSLIGNPFNAGGSWSIRNGVNGRIGPMSPYAWSNVLSVPAPPSMVDRSSQFGSPTFVVPGIPSGTSSTVGPYGITLPANHPLRAGSR